MDPVRTEEVTRGDPRRETRKGRSLEYLSRISSSCMHMCAAWANDSIVLPRKNRLFQEIVKRPSVPRFEQSLFVSLLVISWIRRWSGDFWRCFDVLLSEDSGLVIVVINIDQWNIYRKKVYILKSLILMKIFAKKEVLIIVALAV